MVDRKARKRIQALEERAARRDREVAELSSTVSRLAATVEAVRASSPRPSPAVPPSHPTRAPSVPSVTAPKAPNATSPAAARNPPPSQGPPPAPSAVALPAARAGFASLIVADFPALFAEFRGKRLTLLWRGSRDGFDGDDFHGRCDGHAPTLTLIQDTKGNVFGGFTPVEWMSPPQPMSLADPSLKSFLFTLKNPHNFPPKKFALKAKEKHMAIICVPPSVGRWGPHFRDIFISDNCNASTDSFSDLGGSYANDTRLRGETVLTGSKHFTVKEIEIFEVAD
jgi:hypothetical protein